MIGKGHTGLLKVLVIFYSNVDDGFMSFHFIIIPLHIYIHFLNSSNTYIFQLKMFLMAEGYIPK